MTDENTQPPALEPENRPTTAQATDNGWAGITSIILGGFDLFTWILPICGAPLSIIGIVLGILGLKSSNRGLSIAGIVMNAMGLVLSIAWMAGIVALASAGWFDNITIDTWFSW
jgi:hypothetical protein